MRKATITVPASMSEETYAMLCKGITKKYGEDITFEKRVDNAVLGGFVLKLDGMVYDRTVKSQLLQMEKHFQN